MAGRVDNPPRKNRLDVPAGLAGWEALEDRCLLDAWLGGATWAIRGDADHIGQNDTILVEYDGQDSTLLRVIINGEVVDTQPVDALRRVVVWAGSGDDTVRIGLTGQERIRTIVFGGLGDNHLEGGGGVDFLFGGPGSNFLAGGGGDDRLFGGHGNDTITGGDGNDWLFGGNGNDSLDGGEGDDRLFGGNGSDSLIGGGGNDRLWSGNGGDTLDGGAGNDRLVAGNGSDSLTGGEGDDLLRSGNGGDTLDGGAGNDRLVAGNGSDSLIGGGGDDWLWSGNGSDSLDGGAGNDFLAAGNGDDTLAGGDGEDRLYAGAGADTLAGGEGNDLLVGGPGADTIFTHPQADRVYSDRRDILMDEVSNLLDSFGALEGPLSANAEQVRDVFIDAAVLRYSPWFGVKYDPRTYYWSDGPIRGPVALAGDTFTTIEGMDVTNDASGTNVQEQGVDEGDIVETDGQHLYLFSGGSLTIVNAWPAEQLEIISTTPIEGSPVAMYLQGNLLTIISTARWWYQPVWQTQVDAWRQGGFEPWVQTTVLDVSDPAKPAQLEKTIADGTYVSSRLIGERLYVITSYWADLGMPKVSTDPQTGEMRYETEDAYRRRALEAAGDWLPRTVVQTADGQSVLNVLNVGGRVLRPNHITTSNLLSVEAFDLTDDQGGPAACTTFVGASGEVYASADSLYIAVQDWRAGATDLYKLDLTGQDIPLVATGSIPGYIPNPFCMDEQDGSFRAVAQVGLPAVVPLGGERPDAILPMAGTAVFNLVQVEDRLQVNGVVGGIATGEQIRAARFIGDTVYVVTFRQVDPLFIIDLSVPTAPVVAGELELPGFSGYLHPLDEGHLIGLGMEGDDAGRLIGAQVSLFDVTDPAAPRRLDAYSLGDWLWPEGMNDHHAFGYYSEYQTLAIPLGQTLEVLTVSVEDGLEYVGSIKHADAVRRSVRIGSFLYSISAAQVNVCPIDQPGTIVDSVDLPGSGGVVWPAPWAPVPVPQPIILPSPLDAGDLVRIF